MRINIDGLTVYFPYPRVYPEQYEYMCSLKETLDAGGHAILEMPTGTGKTVTLLSFITSYHLHRPEMAKLIYCTRTVGEMQKVLEELRVVVHNRDRLYAEDDPSGAASAPSMLALGLTTRRNLCLHPVVSAADSREEADAACRSLTASWVRSSAIQQNDTSSSDAAINDDRLCEYFERYQRDGVDAILPHGIYTLDDMMTFGRSRKWCPYYTARHALSFANVIVYNYQYLLDPKIAGLISKSLARESIVVFDEAHNIDNICIDALTVSIREVTLRRSLGSIRRLRDAVQHLRDSDRDRLQREYSRLLRGLSTSGLVPDTNASDLTLASPVVPQDIVEETVPGNIRKAEHFINFLRRFIQFLRDRKMNGSKTQVTVPMRFLHEIRQEMMEDTRPLRFCSERLKSLLQTLQITNVGEFTPLQLVADFATLLGTYGHEQNFGTQGEEAYMQSFSIVFEPVDDRLPHIPDPVLQLACLDASLAIKPVFQRFQSVVLTSGTISPMDRYAQILGFQPKIMRSFQMSMQRQAICPLIVTRGPDQAEITSQFQKRSDTAVVRNYGNLAVELAGIVPDGIVVFFTSYVYMEQVISMWHEMGVIRRMFERKLVFIETPDSVESALALDRYRRACDTGRGAIFLCVARGKVAEGIDFDRHYGRAVLVVGVPFQYTEDLALRARLEFMRVKLGIRESEFLSFDAMRQTAQCAGRVIRNKNDYGVIIFADKRYVRADKRTKLPRWILDLMPDSQVDLDSTAAISIVRSYVRSMAQPLREGDLHKVLLTEEQVKELSQAKFAAAVA